MNLAIQRKALLTRQNVHSLAQRSETRQRKMGKKSYPFFTQNVDQRPSKGALIWVFLAVTVGFEPSLQANGCWCDQRDPRDSAEVGHMCAHLKTGSYRNSVTAGRSRYRG